MFVSSSDLSLSCILLPVPVCCLCLPCISHLWRLHYLLCSGGAELLALSARGQLQRIILPAGREDAGSSNLPSTQVGRGVRDLLSAIGDVCERYAQNDPSLIPTLKLSTAESCYALHQWFSIFSGHWTPSLFFHNPEEPSCPPPLPRCEVGGKRVPKQFDRITFMIGSMHIY